MRSLSSPRLPVRVGNLALPPLVLCAHAASAVEVRIYTDADHPIAAPPTVRVIRLDEPASVKSELSNGLPNDPLRAAQMVRERLGADGQTFTHRLSMSYRGVVDAWHLGVLKLPAIVVDGHYVVYGDPDVAHALSLIERYRSLPR